MKWQIRPSNTEVTNCGGVEKCTGNSWIEHVSVAVRQKVYMGGGSNFKYDNTSFNLFICKMYTIQVLYRLT